MPCGVGLVSSVMSSRPGRFLSRPDRLGGGRGAMVSGAACSCALGVQRCARVRRKAPGEAVAGVVLRLRLGPHGWIPQRGCV